MKCKLFTSRLSINDSVYASLEDNPAKIVENKINNWLTDENIEENQIISKEMKSTNNIIDVIIFYSNKTKKP